MVQCLAGRRALGRPTALGPYMYPRTARSKMARIIRRSFLFLGVLALGAHAEYDAVDALRDFMRNQVLEASREKSHDANRP